MKAEAAEIAGVNHKMAKLQEQCDWYSAENNTKMEVIANMQK